MLLLLSLLGCTVQPPETAEEWCVVAYGAVCDCQSTGLSYECTPSGISAACTEHAAAKVEAFGEDYAVTLYTCMAEEHSCPDEWDECPAPPE